MSRAPGLNASGAREALTVIAGILVDSAGRVLVAERPHGTHMAGYWEFPGGKLNAGESPLEGLCRELAEELGVAVESAEPFCKEIFHYPERTVHLDVWWVEAFSGEPSPLERQRLRWISPPEFGELAMLPADEPIVAQVCERLVQHSAR